MPASNITIKVSVDNAAIERAFVAYRRAFGEVLTYKWYEARLTQAIMADWKIGKARL